MAGKRKKSKSKFRLSTVTNPVKTKTKTDSFSASRTLSDASVAKTNTIAAINQKEELENSNSTKRFGRRKLNTNKKSNMKLPKISGTFRLTVKAVKLLRSQPRAILWILIVYGILTILLVRGFGGGPELTTAKESLVSFFKGQGGGISSAVTIFNSLLSNNGSNASASAYQTLLVIITSLALIWTYRHANEKVKAKDGFYRGTSQFIPYIMVLLVLVLKLIPLLIGSTLFSIVLANGLAISILEKVIWLFVFILLSFLSLYLIASSVMATYIASLPDSMPLKSLRLSRRIVKHRRFAIIGRIISLLFILLITFSLIMIPVILWLTVAASWTVFILGLMAIALIHAYLFSMYQELI